MSLTNPELETAEIEKIVLINERCRGFWSKAHGWAPEEAAQLLSKSRLDWQVSLSHTLNIWNRPSLTDGDLILAWANLGALAEGTVKLFLSVYYLDFSKDIEALKYANAYDKKKGQPIDPDGLSFNKLLLFLKKKELFEAADHEFLELVRSRRNAIHAYQDRPIGNANEYRAAVSFYSGFVERVETRLPYPDFNYP